MDDDDGATPDFITLAAQAHDHASYRIAAKHLVDRVARHAAAAGWKGTGPLPLPDGILDPPVCVAAAEPSIRAHLHGLAEHLAASAGLPPPAWTADPSSFLEAPVFAGGARSRPFLIARAPAAFRRRLLFCSDPLAGLAGRSGGSLAKQQVPGDGD